jgi:hypothetical protein
MVRIKQKQALRPKDRAHLSFFAAAMLARVEPFTDAIGRMLRGVQMQARRLEEKRASNNKLSDEIAEELVNHVGDTVSIAVVQNQKMLERTNLTIFTVDDDDGFITSDSPGCLCVPGPPPVELHPFGGHKGVEFTLPLSPHHLAIYTWTGGRVRYQLETRRLVDEANSRTVSGCVKEFVSWKGTVRREWLATRRA